MPFPRSLLLAGAAALSLTACATQAPENKPAAGAVAMNQIQVIGTHNSYHAGIAASESVLWKKTRPELYAALDYRHQDLTSQLSAGVRQVELDIFADSKGGLYAHPAGPGLAARAGLPADPPFDPNHLMDKPGFKVMHVQDVDYRSTCQPFTACLAEIHAWSKAHPGHVPLFILLETKEETLSLSFPTVTPEALTPASLDALDREILSVFKADEIITPDRVRGDAATLNAAVRTHGWPSLEEARGKVVFLLDQRNISARYLEGHPSLKGRVAFTNAQLGPDGAASDDAAFIEMNDGPGEAITTLVRQGYLVRTRSDADTKEARANDTRRRDMALGSGAQMVSTDYPASEPAATGFVVSLPGGGAARCNPVTAGANCVSQGLDR
ncbi:phosphatidylinositol-specific phospholipase C1-like protein [Nitrospirillum sp. BR 11828]|uniref:phosphatidylinositol-specific phospholipase C1-like protein n=1 Tax=Nitrospirillum sp. BR 11828 TaxID=3104325 RepID=UPI002ACA4E8B|nr:phosphatidylinositol-specific phospholipase C1-like protein [Nitrospirillum sp. BR 11828]MDZ5650595.1 phosphatidylinositol-specific phospholipase C1-like protein [Nitrospirillum sp. BR 11828]